MFPLRPPFINFPFFNFYNYRRPSYYQPNLYRNSNYYKNFSHNGLSTVKGTNSDVNLSNPCFPSSVAYSKIICEDNLSNDFSNSNLKQKKLPLEPDDEYFFEIFGLKLYFDDVLLICLLFFLYEEGVKDQELFISLILLLLS